MCGPNSPTVSTVASWLLATQMTTKSIFSPRGKVHFPTYSTRYIAGVVRTNLCVSLPSRQPPKKAHMYLFISLAWCVDHCKDASFTGLSRTILHNVCQGRSKEAVRQAESLSLSPLLSFSHSKSSSRETRRKSFQAWRCEIPFHYISIRVCYIAKCTPIIIQDARHVHLYVCT